MLNALAAVFAGACERSELARSTLRRLDFPGKRRVVAHLRGERLPTTERLAVHDGIAFLVTLRDDVQRQIYFDT